MRLFTILSLIALLAGCYSIPEINGFDKDLWASSSLDCSDQKEKMAEVLLSQDDKLLSEGEAEIKGLLGNPDEHELYQRNQKFFYYNLNAAECSERKRLSIRFDALDRVKEVMIIQQ